MAKNLLIRGSGITTQQRRYLDVWKEQFIDSAAKQIGLNPVKLRRLIKSGKLYIECRTTATEIRFELRESFSTVAGATIPYAVKYKQPTAEDIARGSRKVAQVKPVSRKRGFFDNVGTVEYSKRGLRTEDFKIEQSYVNQIYRRSFLVGLKKFAPRRQGYLQSGGQFDVTCSAIPQHKSSAHYNRAPLYKLKPEIKTSSYAKLRKDYYWEPVDVGKHYNPYSRWGRYKSTTYGLVDVHLDTNVNKRCYIFSKSPGDIPRLRKVNGSLYYYAREDKGDWKCWPRRKLFVPEGARVTYMPYRGTKGYVGRRYMRDVIAFASRVAGKELQRTLGKIYRSLNAQVEYGSGTRYVMPFGGNKRDILIRDKVTNKPIGTERQKIHADARAAISILNEAYDKVNEYEKQVFGMSSREYRSRPHRGRPRKITIIEARTKNPWDRQSALYGWMSPREYAKRVMDKKRSRGGQPKIDRLKRQLAQQIEEIADNKLLSRRMLGHGDIRLRR